MYISTNDWLNYINKLSKLNKSAADAIVAYVQKNGFSDTDALISYANAVVQTYGSGSAALAAAMYDATAEAAGYFYDPAEPAALPGYGEIAKTVKGTLKTSQNVNELAGAVSRLVKRAGADTTLQNAYRDRPRKKYGKKRNTGAQIAWVPHGDTCPFCLMLASNGWRNQTVGGAQNHAEHIHSNCDCTYAVRFDDHSGVQGYDPDVYKDMYDNAEGDTWKEKVNSMRRAQYAKDKDRINAQKRAAYAERVGNLENEESRKREKALFKNTRINKEAYSEKALRAFTDSLEDTEISREIYKNAKEMLEHRDGTHFEDLAYIDTVKGKSLINKAYDFYDEKKNKSACKPSKPMKKLLREAEPGTVIGLHNHPQSYVPSDSDIMIAYERQYKYGLIFAHNGTKFKYHVNENYDPLKVHLHLDNLQKALYDKNTEKIKTYIDDLKKAGVDMEVFL